MWHLQAPVFRELYTEKKVVAEERRARIDNSPLGRFVEAFCSAAFASPYAHPVIGKLDAHFCCAVLLACWYMGNQQSDSVSSCEQYKKVRRLA